MSERRRAVFAEKNIGGSTRPKRPRDVIDTVVDPATLRPTSGTTGNGSPSPASPPRATRRPRDLYIPTELVERLKAERLHPTDMVLAALDIYGNDVERTHPVRQASAGPSQKMRVRLTDQQLDRLKRLAGVHHLSVSAISVILLRRYLDDHLTP